MRSLSIVGVFVLSVLLSSDVTFADNGIKSSVVKIYTVVSKYNYYQPWQKRTQFEGTGSGCIIKGNRILTNAHVVSDSTFLQVKRSGDATKYVATVEVIAHECDLAILRVEDQRFFEGAVPLEVGDLPEVRDKVVVYGFPTGGDELSITEGVVSRIEHVNYSHSSAYLLACQIDAAINPGNSGGPVILADKIIGVAFQSFTAGENIGYMVPAPLIRHFLVDISDGTYGGIPELGIELQNMENPDLRKKYKLAANQTGVLVNRIEYTSPVKGVIKLDDIILSVDGTSVENDGTIEFRPGERTFMGYAVQKKFVRDVVNIDVVREGVSMRLPVVLTAKALSGRLVPYEHYDSAPSYYIRGGLLFEPLTKNFLQEWGNEWYNKAPINLLNYYFNGNITDSRKEIVVLVMVFADEINVGYHGWGNMVITKVNGKKIHSLHDVIEAFHSNKGEYNVIEDESSYKIVLSREKVNLFSDRILKRYNISSERSPDLQGM